MIESYILYRDGEQSPKVKELVNSVEEQLSRMDCLISRLSQIYDSQE